MPRSFVAALALAATVLVGGAAFAQNASMYTTSGSTTVSAPSALDGLHTNGTGGRAYPHSQKTN